MSSEEIRRAQKSAPLDTSSVAGDPLEQFRRWFDEAVQAEVWEPTAMALGTATREGMPSVRMVLLKGADERGFTFFTDYRSRKGRELEENPRAALCFHWSEVDRQIRIAGDVTRLGRDESEAYYRTRPMGRRLGAWASHQSTVLKSRDELEARVQEVEARFDGEPPLPPHWGGYLLAPREVEFWQNRESRLHDRVRYRLEGKRWILDRLSP